MSPVDVKRGLQDYVEAVNLHDVTRMMANRHPQASLQLMGTGLVIEPRDTLDDFYRSYFAATPGYRLQIDDGLFAEATGVVWGHITDATAHPEQDSVPVVFVCTFQDGQFRHDHMYTDFTRLAALFGKSA